MNERQSLFRIQQTPDYFLFRVATKNITPLQNKLPVQEQKTRVALGGEDAELFYGVSNTASNTSTQKPCPERPKAIQQIITRDPDHPSSRPRSQQNSVNYEVDIGVI